MEDVTKIQMLEKIRRFRYKSQCAILYMMDKNCAGISYFVGSQNDDYDFISSEGNVQVFPVSNSILGKLQREGLIQKSGMFNNRLYVYEISELLKNITIKDFFIYVENYKFYKDNSGIIDRMYQEQKLSKEEYEHWTSCFYDSISKRRFDDFKKLQKDIKDNFSLGQKVAFYDKDKYGKTYRKGIILKMNPTRAIVQEISFKNGWIQLWNCTYNSLYDCYSNEPAQFISHKKISCVA